MTTPIAPGVWIEAADDIGRHHGGTKPYLCDAVVPMPPTFIPCRYCPDVTDGIKIKGLPNSTRGLAWCPNHWRPIYRPPTAFKESLFERNLLPNEEIERIYTDAII